MRYCRCGSRSSESVATNMLLSRCSIRRPRALARCMTTQRKGYEAFGSFHTPSPAALFAGEMPHDLPDPSTFLPPVPAHQLEFSGKNRELFTIDFTRWTYLNHGAFGGPTRYASSVAAAWREFADAQPLLFNDRLLFPYIVQSIQALARVLHIADAQELVLLPNATSGLHSVIDCALRHVDTLDHSDTTDVVFCFSTRYGAVRKMLQSVETARGRRKPLRLHEEPLSLAESYDDAVVMAKLERALDRIQETQDTRCALVVIDHITSNTGVLLPVKDMVAACHARQIPVLVDGAHGLFNLDLDVDELSADFYVGNCHKWFASPKGAAFLHVNQRTHVESMAGLEVQPRIVSHGFLDGYQSAFMWTGLQDYSPWLSLPSCIAYWDHLDAVRCRKYMHSLIQESIELLYTAWGMADQLEEARSFPQDKRHAMRLVQLPLESSVFGVEVNGRNTSADAKNIQDTLHHHHRIEVPVKCVDGVLYLRLSAYVYNSLADYEHLGQVIRGGMSL